MKLIPPNLSVEDFDQDSWSLEGKVFGELSQLVVVGHLGRNKTNRLYVVKCSLCSKDFEMYGSGFFLSTKSNLVKGSLPCGCSVCPKYTEEQWIIKLSRVSLERGYDFLGCTEGPITDRSLLRLSCPQHGKWETTTASKFLAGRGCPSCKKLKIGKSSSCDDSDMIEQFKKLGRYPPDTIFYRSERKTSQGFKTYWWIECPICEEKAEAISRDIKRGAISCGCNNQNQKQAYINLIKDFEVLIALKFGISYDSKIRLRSQANQSVFDMESLGIWEFSNTLNCKLAENKCKQIFDCGVISKILMPDGYTETTDLRNIDEIIGIYESFGGVRL